MCSILLGYLLPPRTKYNCPYGLQMFAGAPTVGGTGAQVLISSPLSICRWFVPFAMYDRIMLSSFLPLLPCVVLNAFSLHRSSQRIRCLLDLFTEREVSAELAGPGTGSGSACP